MIVLLDRDFSLLGTDITINGSRITTRMSFNTTCRFSANHNLVKTKFRSLGRDVARFSPHFCTVSPGDYTLGNSSSQVQVQFERGSFNGDVKCIHIGIMEDDILEGSETFTVELSNILYTHGPATIRPITSANVYIKDNDGKLILSI